MVSPRDEWEDEVRPPSFGSTARAHPSARAASLAMDRDGILRRRGFVAKLRQVAASVERIVNGVSDKAIARRLLVQRAKAVAMSKAFGAFRRLYTPNFSCSECLRAFPFRSDLVLHLKDGCADAGKVWFLRSDSLFSGGGGV